MPKSADESQPKSSDPIPAFFSQFQGDPRAIDAYRFAQALRRVTERNRLIALYFADTKTFSRHVEEHPLSGLMQKKIQRILELRQTDLKRLARSQDISARQLDAMAPVEKYFLLVTAQYVDPSAAFPDIPPYANLCELKGVHDYYSDRAAVMSDQEQTALKQEWVASLKYFRHRWQAITGKDLAVDKWPTLSEVTRLLSPVPLRPAWNPDLASREALKLKHSPALAPGLLPNHPRQSDPRAPAADDLAATTASGPAESKASRDIGTGGPSSHRSTTLADAAGDEPSPGSTNGDHGGGPPNCGPRCDVNSIYELAGARGLGQPGANDPHYTFPGALNQREDIFYDYALMIPVQECGPFAPEIVGPDRRSLEGAIVLARMAEGLLAFLTSQGLQTALGVDTAGKEVVADLNALMDKVLNLQPDASKDDIRVMRRDLGQMATVIRTISRARMLVSPVAGADPTRFLQALTNALNAFPQIASVLRHVPTRIEDGEVDFALQLSDPGARENAVFHEQLQPGEEGQFFPPDASKEGRVDLKWTWQTSYQNKILSRYVQYLGDTFTKKLTALLTAAGQMRDAVQAFAGGSPSALDQFARLAEGVIHDTLFALARLFDEIGEQLSLLSPTAGEGSKRLALMVTFRQYWHPDGYVQGKLVGYRNLLPNQKESLKRRTFVKTTREITSAEEFVASREADYTRSSKETSEIVREGSWQFNLTTNASGHFDIGIGGLTADVSTGLDLRQMSRQTQSQVSEATQKSASKYSDKREVKVRQLTEVEDVQEVTTEVSNLNREITANYFYYQLLRQYQVTMELHDLRPVLLRTRDVPVAGAIDDRFLWDYAHILVHALPQQLSVDMQETASNIEALTRAVIRRRSDLDHRIAAYEAFSRSPAPTDTDGATRWQAQMDSMERLQAEALAALDKAEEDYLRARSRLDRVVTHVRENSTYYMQFIWQASPKIDQDRILQEENFHGVPLAQLTRGLSRLGYFGNEEIFEYDGLSVALLCLLISSLEAGADVAAIPKDQLLSSALYQQLRQYYSADNDADSLIDRIRSHAFLRDPADHEDLFNSRCVQVAQDALVVETFPGQIPLLESFQMAHRMLDVQKACLENAHLNERINDRAWQRAGEDTYKVLRREGVGGASEQEIDINLASPPPRTTS